MTEGVNRLFVVEGKYSSTWRSRMTNFGDNYGELYDFTETVVNKTSDEAINQVWTRMENNHKEHQEKAKEILAEIKVLKEKEDNIGAVKRFNRATSLWGELSPIPPLVPRDREKWIAREVKVEGYRIVLVSEPAGMLTD